MVVPFAEIQVNDRRFGAERNVAVAVGCGFGDKQGFHGAMMSGECCSRVSAPGRACYG
jgi:hypothetical protein